MRTPIQQKVKHGKTRQNGSRKTTALDLRGMQQKFFWSQRSHCPWGLGSQRSQTFWLSLLRLQMCPKKEHVSFVYAYMPILLSFLFVTEGKSQTWRVQYKGAIRIPQYKMWDLKSTIWLKCFIFHILSCCSFLQVEKQKECL